MHLSERIPHDCTIDIPKPPRHELRAQESKADMTIAISPPLLAASSQPSKRNSCPDASRQSASTRKRVKVSPSDTPPQFLQPFLLSSSLSHLFSHPTQSLDKVLGRLMTSFTFSTDFLLDDTHLIQRKKCLVTRVTQSRREVSLDPKTG
jgi:hypothetical protein